MKKLFCLSANSIWFLVIPFFLLSSCAGLSKRETARVYYNLGNAYFELGKNSKASEAYLRALEFDKKLKVASFNLARSYIEAEKYIEALELLDSMLDDEPDNTLILSSKGYCLYRYGDYHNAADNYLKVLDINPADQEALFNYALIMAELKDYDGAIQKFAELKRTNINDADLLSKIDFAVGRVYYVQEKYSESLKYFEAVLQKEPDYKENLEYLFDIYEREKYYEKMIKTGEKIIKSDPDEIDVIFKMSRILLLEIEDRELGIEYFRKAIEKGFKDKVKIKEILDDDNLTGREEIEKILEKAEIFDD